MSEQIVINLSAEMDTLTEAIFQAESANTIERYTLWNDDRSIAAEKFVLTDEILNERFADGNLKYTNDKQRAVALEFAMNQSTTFRDVEVAKIVRIRTIANTDAAIDRDKRLLKSKELKLTYYSNLP